MGLKRPSTAIGSSQKTTSTSKPANVSSMMSSIASKVGSKVKTDMAKATPSKRVNLTSQPPGPVSAEKDEVDEIYKCEDPIETSIGIRKKGGSLQTVVPDKNAKVGKFFFTLRTKGPEVKITQEALKASQIMAGAKVDSSGNVVEDEGLVRMFVDKLEGRPQLALVDQDVVKQVVLPE